MLNKYLKPSSHFTGESMRLNIDLLDSITFPNQEIFETDLGMITVVITFLG